MREILLCPELNYWIVKTLRNSPLTDTFTKIPTPVTEAWRDSRSVLELLFNENFNPQPTPDSSSSSIPGITNVEIINDRPYIWKYRTCNIDLISSIDKNVPRRLQVYRWTAKVYACNSNQFLNIFDYADSANPNVPRSQGPFTSFTAPSGDVETSPQKDYYSWLDISRSTPTLPRDTNDRSPFITYRTEIYNGGSYPLVYPEQKAPLGPFPPEPIYPDAQNLFNFTAADFYMLDLLYIYKTGGIVSLDGIIFNELTCLAKLIYIYLDAFINDNYIQYTSADPISGDDILCTTYEKFVIDMICLLKNVQYGVIYKETEVINNEVKEINIERFLIMKKENQRVLITPEIYDAGEIVLTEKLPWDRRDFVIFRDGDTLENDKDYTVINDYSDPQNVVCRVHLINNNILPGETIEYIYSYVEPYATPLLDVDQ